MTTVCFQPKGTTFGRLVDAATGLRRNATGDIHPAPAARR
jgi:hypothetical protein